MSKSHFNENLLRLDVLKDRLTGLQPMEHYIRIVEDVNGGNRE